MLFKGIDTIPILKELEPTFSMRPENCPPHMLFKREGIKIFFTACKVDGLDRGHLWDYQARQTMEEKMGSDLFLVLPRMEFGRKLL